MPKPIFTIGLPSQTTREAYEETSKEIGRRKDLLEDYYVLVYINPRSEDFCFNTFYEKDFDEVKLEELKQFIQDETQNK